MFEVRISESTDSYVFYCILPNQGKSIGVSLYELCLEERSQMAN